MNTRDTNEKRENKIARNELNQFGIHFLLILHLLLLLLFFWTAFIYLFFSQLFDFSHVHTHASTSCVVVAVVVVVAVFLLQLFFSFFSFVSYHIRQDDDELCAIKWLTDPTARWNTQASRYIACEQNSWRKKPAENLFAVNFDDDLLKTTNSQHISPVTHSQRA